MNSPKSENLGVDHVVLEMIRWSTMSHGVLWSQRCWWRLHGVIGCRCWCREVLIIMHIRSSMCDVAFHPTTLVWRLDHNLVSKFSDNLVRRWLKRCWQFVLVVPLQDNFTRSSGSLVLIFLLNRSSAGLTPVVECGVLRWANRNVGSSFFQSCPLELASVVAFNRVRVCLSTSPFACGHNGVTCLCSIPFSDV